MKHYLRHRPIEAAKMVVKPEALVWVVGGDRSKIEDSIKAMGFEKIHYIDADGNLQQAC